MDIFSHGLYGGVTVGRGSKQSYWTAFFFGVFPDVFAFGIPISHLLFSLLSGGNAEIFHSPEDSHASIPSYVFSLYNISHSLIIFILIFGLVWFFRKKPFWEMSAWGLHIVVDIFTHSEKFFPTPFLWPVSDFYVNGHSWGSPEVFIPNVLCLAILYGAWWHQRKKVRMQRT